MRTKVTRDGLLIPATLLEHVEEVELQSVGTLLVIVPITDQDPILALGSEPLECEIPDASLYHDAYITSPNWSYSKADSAAEKA